MLVTKMGDLKEEDKIKSVKVDENGKVLEVTLEDNTTFSFEDFAELFKQNLRTIVAGEVISWDDEWRYQRQIDPKTMEQYLDVVEAEGLVANSKFNLTRGQKLSLGVMIIIIFVLVIAAIMLKNSGLV